MAKSKKVISFEKIGHPAVDASIQEEYAIQKALFEAQTAMVRRFLEAQARRLADAIHKKQFQVSFTLPDRLIPAPGAAGCTVPVELRAQMVGGVIDRLTRSDFRTLLHEKLAELEGSENPAVSAAAQLIQHAIALHMVTAMLPSGRSVTYRSAEDEEIPTLPVESEASLASAITEASDAIVGETGESIPQAESGRGELQVPFVTAARRFYLPQWVAFDDHGHLLVSSTSQAEAYLASMQAYLAILHFAVSLAPYMIADPVYQQKRYGMLGQLINQGRALAAYQTEEMIREIKHRAAAHDLNRGLSLSLPYFDDQALAMHTHDFQVIPAGRIMFVPAFVVRAGRGEMAKVAQDTRLSPSTRKYLLKELKTLEKAFEK